jgi:hypothetical protein
MSLKSLVVRLRSTIRSAPGSAGHALANVHPMVFPVLVGFAIPPVVLMVFLSESEDARSVTQTAAAAASASDPVPSSSSAIDGPETQKSDISPAPVAARTELLATAQSIAESAVSSVLADAGSVPQEAGRRQWMDWLESLHAMHEERKADAARRLEQINIDAQTIVANADFDGFIEHATGLVSKGKYAANQYAWRAWIKDLYCEYLFPPEALTALVTGHLQSLGATQAAMSEQALIDLGVDCELQPMSTASPGLDAVALDSAIDEGVGAIIPELEMLMAEHVVTFVGSAAVSEVGYEAARELAADENGEVSFAGEVAALLVGLGTDIAVTSAVEELSPTTDNLRQSLRRSTDQLVQSCLLSGPAGDQLVSDVVDVVGQYDAALVAVLIDHLGVERDWAVDAFLKRVVDRSGE